MTIRTSVQRNLCAVLAGVAIAGALSGCAAPARPSASLESAAPAANVAFWSAPCNLGEVWDEAAGVRLATYAEPTLPSQLYHVKYGPTIANEACSDGEILQWQALRRDRGEQDEICKIAWVVLDVSATVYDLGCARPEVVIEP